MSTVSAETFLAVEASLTLRLTSTYSELLRKIKGQMDRAAEAKDWGKLEDLIDQIDLAHVYDLNEDYIKYLSNVAILFGAARVTGMTRDTSAVSLGFAAELVQQVMNSFRQMLVTTGEDRIKSAALDYLSFLRSPPGEEGSYLGRVLKFHNVGFNEAAHPRVPAGSSEGGQFTEQGGGAAVAEKPKTLPKAPRTAPEALNPLSVPEGTPEYGKPHEGSVSVLGVHYSKEARAYLTGTHHGQGLKDAADERLSEPGTDKRLKDRIYFYVDEGHGVVPESGVGGIKHTVLLRNLYDPQMDHGKVWSQGKGDANASEKAVLDAGFDGYYVRNFANQSGVAVLLGDHTVKTKVNKGDIEVADLAASGGLKNPDQGTKKKRKARPDYALAMKDEGDKNPSVLPFSSFVDSAGRTFFNIASSLHTSRLSAFGFTAEADYLGVKQYRIDEQLDNRTCPVCEYMDGKVFDVEDARGFLDTVVRTEDADELKSLQPWPSQSKQGLQDLKSLSNDELVMSGWHVPPFHPRCRGLLAKVLSIAASPTTQQQEATAEGPYIATAADFNQLGVSLSPARIEKWNQVMQASPAAVIAGLTGQTEQEVVQAALDSQDPKTALGIQALTLASNGTVNIELLRELTSASGQVDSVTTDLYFRQDRKLFIGSVEPLTSEAAAASAAFKEVMTDIYGTAEQLGLPSIEAIAGSDMGGFAMAKYGFAPTMQGWENVKEQITRILAKSGIKDMLTDDELLLLDAILESDDPKDIFALADMPHLGEVLLSGSTYQGFLDMQDPESVARFLTYLSGYESVAKFSPDQPRHPAGSSEGGQWAREPNISAPKPDAAAQRGKEPYLYPKAKPALGSGKTNDENAGFPPVNEDALKNVATELGVVVKRDGSEALLDQAQENMRKLLADSVIQINVRSADTLDMILSDGRFKSQFETHTSGGSLDPSRRSHTEAELFGVPVKRKPADRPIYGSVQSPWTPPRKEDYSTGDDDHTRAYGNSLIRLKGDVKARTTFTGDDSLSSGYSPSRLNDPKMASFLDREILSYDFGLKNKDDVFDPYVKRRLLHMTAATSVSGLKSGSYVEAQIHGGVKVSDISDIWVRKEGYDTPAQWMKDHLSDKSVQAIKDNEIKVHLYDSPIYA
jgi:hypothetical protein